MMMLRIRTMAGAGCLAAAVVGCSNYPHFQHDSGPLRGASIPSTFSFQTTRPVDVTLTADKALFGSRTTAGIELTDGNGAVVYRGAIRAGAPLGVHLAVPSKDGAVKATFRAPGVEKTALVAINQSAASHTFQ